MSLLAPTHAVAPTSPHPRIRRFRPRSALRAAILVASIIAVIPARGQTTTLSQTDDASPVPEGMLRFRVLNSWTNDDSRFTTTGLSPLGADFSTAALGPTQLPLLAPVWSGLQTLASPNARLSLGQLSVGSNVRIVTTPISLDYGLTSRLSIGLVVPIVQTRRVARATVNGDTSAAVRGTVGFVPVASRSAAASANLAMANAYQRAADSLSARISSCQANPAGAGCSAVTSNAAAAAALVVQAQAFAAAARTLGTDASHAVVAPLANSPLADSINTRLTLLNQQLTQYLGAGYGSTGTVYTAPFPFSYIDLQGNDQTRTPGLLQSPLGGGLDSIYTTNSVGLGDIALTAQYLVIDRFQHDTLPIHGLQSRLAVGGAWRFNTSRADTATNLVDIATGTGPGVEVNSALDLVAGRVGGTIATRYVKSFPRTVTTALFGDPQAAWVYPVFGSRDQTAGSVFGVDLIPRVFLNESLSIDGHYGYQRVGPTTYSTPDINAAVASCPDCVFPAIVTTSGSTIATQSVGIGFRYSTVDAYLRHRAKYPIELSFTHLTTITGDPGVPKYNVDQISLRLYYRLRSN